MTSDPTRVRIVGTGRAGGSFAGALSAAGWRVDLVHHDHPDPCADVDLVLSCVPDRAVAALAGSWPVHAETVVAHCAGSLGLDALRPHQLVASVHPLVSLPDPAVGQQRLVGAWFGVAGDQMARRVVGALGGTAFDVTDADRVVYHAAAAVASNHLVALMGQVERLAALVGVPLEAFRALAAGSLANVAASGPAAALTGPVVREDWETVDRHLAALPPDERDAYRVLAEQAARLAGVPLPPGGVGDREVGIDP